MATVLSLYVILYHINIIDKILDSVISIDLIIIIVVTVAPTPTVASFPFKHYIGQNIVVPFYARMHIVK